MAYEDILTDISLTDNANFVSPVEFRFVLKRAPNIKYFCQAATLPSLSMNIATQSSPLLDIPRAGDKLRMGSFNITFKVDEDLQNYYELYHWMWGLGHPQKLNQYRQLQESEPSIVSDATLIILSSHSNGNVRVNLEDAFPISLSPLQFDASDTGIEYIACEAEFSYRLFTVGSL